MPSSTEACNLALSHIGVSKEIQDLDTEQSREATACRRFYETARKATLRDAEWPFATKSRTLDLVETDPTDEWGFSYSVPVDCLRVRRIISGTWPETSESKIPFRLAFGTASELLFTNQSEADLEYIVNITDPGRWPPDFLMAFSYRLAMYLAPRLTAGDPFKLGANAARMYDFEIGKSKATAFNEEQPNQPPDPDMIRARE